MFVKRLGVFLAATAIVAVGVVAPASAAPPPTNTVADPVKINVMGVWAHPDDDTSIIGPCGVWHQYYGITCGIIMITRGEGGGNAVGLESGPALGLRRENEDRAAHYRSGTIDIFNLDRVDFYYNTTAPLTEFFWGHDQTLRRVTRIIRETRPDVMVGFSPTLAVGHGNHQYAGRMIWEGMRAAADPTMFPDQLTGPNALGTWLVKKTTSGGSTAGTGGTTASANCTVGFVPNATNLDTDHGVWTGYDSPYLWPAGNVQGRPAGTPKIWAQVASEGAAAYPTQSRQMNKGTSNPGCSRLGVTQSYVPFQPNSSPSAGLDNALFFGAAVPDPGGMPLGSLLYLTFDRFFNVAGGSFQVTVHARSGAGTLPAGNVALTVPAGWTADPAQPIGPIGTGGESLATFTVTPAAGAAAARYKIAANLTTGGATGYTDNVMQVVPAVEGRFHRWGNFSEFDGWANANTLRLGRSNAVEKIGAGETISVAVDVHNWSTTSQSGNVTLALPAGFTADAASKPYAGLAGGADTSVTFMVTHTNPAAAGGNSATATITTSYGAPAGSAAESLSFTIVPQTTISSAAVAPTLDGTEGAGEYTGPAIDLSRVWEGSACNPNGVDCGTGSYAKVNWNADNLYLFVHVVDETQGFPVTPDGCWAHWLTDSVEILLDPRGNSVDTSTTFKTGIFPYTDDPTGSAGNGVNGPCWERDADNHQGYSSGPLAATVDGGPNAVGMQVATNAVLNAGRSYAGGSYNVEVKIPLGILPAAVGPTSAAPTGSAATNVVNPVYMGLNITPYDSDTQDHTGQTRLAWSTFGSQQSEPYRWGHAALAGYTPPAGRSTTPTTPIIPDSALKGIDSPQTIHQAAWDGVPISGTPPTSAMSVSNTMLTASSVEFDYSSTTTGAAHVFLWQGDDWANIPVWISTCNSPLDPLQFTACAASDGGTPPWGTNMSGRIVADLAFNVTAGTHHVSVPINAAGYAALRAAGSALIGFESAAGASRAWDIPLAETAISLTTPANPTPQGPVTFTATVSGTSPFPGTPTGMVQFIVDGSPAGSPVALDGAGQASLTTSSLAPGTHSLTAAYSGDGDYVPGSSAALSHTVYGWNGFFAPLAGPPAVNSVKAGASVPVKFDLGVAQGLDIFAAGYPRLQRINCTTLADIGSPIAAVSVPGLQYDAGANQYVYVWKTDKSWSGTCGRLDIGLLDGTTHSLLFSFK